MNLDLIRKDFPILETQVNGHQIVYFDNGATTQRPLPVVNAVVDYVTHQNGNPHRGAHIFAISASEAYDTSKEVVRDFIHARSEKEIIYTRNTTESLNLVSRSYGETHLKKGDHILITIAEHHSNLVTWQRAAEKTGAVLDYIYIDKETSHFPEEELKKIDDPRVKILAFAQVSNVLGVEFDPKPLIKRAHAHGAVVVLDGAQSTPHKQIDVQDLDCDFFAFSGHKMCSMGGIGVLYAKEELLDEMEPFLMGGDMIETVEEQTTTFAELPAKFEAGTQYVEGAVGLVAAIKYIQAIGYDDIREQERKLVTRCLEGMKKLPFIQIIGPKNPEEKEGLIAFEVEGVHPHDVAQIMSAEGICIRTGHHCAEPLHHYLGVNASCRASFYFYNTEEEVDYFLDKLKDVRKVMGYDD
ncbi:aminotransferase class V-fold PLP-dependent enzyme [Dialister hominis]|uniref:aminotransferase class V-fold PLP-dependent enzyme n=1 Tax=Dialister hominis TaxID=2582419 RepID=UPI004027C6EB